jgi:DNA-binding NarL/FixJ family response regulator
MKTRVLLVDDHAILREGVRTLLERQSNMQVVGEAANGHAAVQMAAELIPHVVVMDVTMPELNGIEATRRIVAERPGTKVIGLSMHSNRVFVSEMFKAGAAGYLLKESSGTELVDAIAAVMRGQLYLSPRIARAATLAGNGSPRTDGDPRSPAFSALTPRERQVLQLVAEGHTTKTIAARLDVSVKTIEAHRTRIMDKLKIHSIAGLTKFAVVEGLTSPEPGGGAFLPPSETSAPGHEPSEQAPETQ